MKQIFTFRFIISFTLTGFVIFSPGCKKSSDSASSSDVVTQTTGLIGHNWAALFGTVNPRNQVKTVAFQYDYTPSYRFSVKGNPGTVGGDSTTSVTANAMGLLSNTTYYFRIMAISSKDTLYGTEQTFTTTGEGTTVITFNPSLNYGSVWDADNNVYQTIAIGNQTWLAENLRTTHLNDGTAIPLVPSYPGWLALTTPGYCMYNNDSLVYGLLYNWYAVNTSKLCPSGWHVPNDSEWNTLITYLGGANVAAGKVKETGTVHWQSPNSGATNETGFTALGGGYRGYSSVYSNIKRIGYWWTSSEYSASYAFYWSATYGYTNMDHGSTPKPIGLSVRCIKN